MNLAGFMADQNEETSEISESPESVSLADAPAEKATQATHARVLITCNLSIDKGLNNQHYQTSPLPGQQEQLAETRDLGLVCALLMKHSIAIAVCSLRRPYRHSKLYLEACRLMKVVPVSHSIQNLAKPYINLNHHGLGLKGVKAIANALANISSNHLDTAGPEVIASLLLDNMSYLHALRLSDFSASDIPLFHPHVGALAWHLVAAGWKISLSLHIHLSSRRVKELDLSHNEFSEKGGQLLRQMLASNTTLEILDLSWNDLKRKGTVALGTGLRGSSAPTILGLSWNGVGKEGALALGEALKVSNVLVHLDISNNQINNKSQKLCRGLEINGKLIILKMASNPLTMEGSTVLSVRKNPKSIMEEINISNVLVNKNFIKLLDFVCRMPPELGIIYGEVEGCIARIPKQHPDSMKFNSLKEHNLQLWDFLRNIDKDGNMKIPVAAFQRAMMQQPSIPLDRVQIGELVCKLDNQIGVVDCR
ncbi:LOW QUALITY PROTEIN: leucine-rich repeat-containing protein 74A [Leptosomus discolor]